MHDEALEYWNKGCASGDVVSCIKKADALIASGRKNEALELLSQTCADIPYLGLINSQHARECDKTRLAGTDDEEARSALVNRLCVMGSDPESCDELVRKGRKSPAVADRARRVSDQNAREAEELLQLEASVRARDYAAYLQKGRLPGTYRAACEAASPEATTWTPLTYTQFVPNVWVGCSVTAENACSIHQLVQLSVVNRGAEPQAINLEWEIEANVPERITTVAINSLLPGGEVSRFDSVEYRGEPGPIRARAFRCRFGSVSIRGASAKPSPGASEVQGRVPCRPFPRSGTFWARNLARQKTEQRIRRQELPVEQGQETRAMPVPGLQRLFCRL